TVRDLTGEGGPQKDAPFERDWWLGANSFVAVQITRVRDHTFECVCTAQGHGVSVPRARYLLKALPTPCHFGPGDWKSSNRLASSATRSRTSRSGLKRTRFGAQVRAIVRNSRT